MDEADRLLAQGYQNWPEVVKRALSKQATGSFLTEKVAGGGERVLMVDAVATRPSNALYPLQ